MKKPTLSDTSSTLRSDVQLEYTPTRRLRAGEYLHPRMLTTSENNIDAQKLHRGHNPHETVLIVWVSTVGYEHASGSRLWLSDLYGGVSSGLNGGVVWEIPLTPARSAEGRGQPVIYR